MIDMDISTLAKKTPREGVEFNYNDIPSGGESSLKSILKWESLDTREEKPSSFNTEWKAIYNENISKEYPVFSRNGGITASYLETSSNAFDENGELIQSKIGNVLNEMSPLEDTGNIEYTDSEGNKKVIGTLGGVAAQTGAEMFNFPVKKFFNEYEIKQIRAKGYSSEYFRMSHNKFRKILNSLELTNKFWQKYDEGYYSKLKDEYLRNKTSFDNFKEKVSNNVYKKIIKKNYPELLNKTDKMSKGMQFFLTDTLVQFGGARKWTQEIYNRLIESKDKGKDKGLTLENVRDIRFSNDKSHKSRVFRAYMIAKLLDSKENITDKDILDAIKDIK